MTRARSSGRSFAPLEELRVRGDRADRRAQLVRCVGDELAELLLGRGATRERILDVTQHRVERGAEPADLGAAVLGDPQAQVAAGDARRRRLDVAQRAQPDAHQPQPETDGGEQRGTGDDELDHDQLVQRAVDLVERQRDEQVAAARQLLEPEAEPRPAVLGVDRRSSERRWGC